MEKLNKIIENILYLICVKYFPLTFTVLIIGMLLFIIFLITGTKGE